MKISINSIIKFGKRAVAYKFRVKTARQISIYLDQNKNREGCDILHDNKSKYCLKSSEDVIVKYHVSFLRKVSKG